MLHPRGRSPVIPHNSPVGQLAKLVTPPEGWKRLVLQLLPCVFAWVDVQGVEQDDPSDRASIILAVYYSSHKCAARQYREAVCTEMSWCRCRDWKPSYPPSRWFGTRKKYLHRSLPLDWQDFSGGPPNHGLVAPSMAIYAFSPGSHAPQHAEAATLLAKARMIRENTDDTKCSDSISSSGSASASGSFCLLTTLAKPPT